MSFSSMHTCVGEIYSLQALRVGRTPVGGGGRCRRVGPGDVEGVEVEAKLANVGPRAGADLECRRTKKKQSFRGSSLVLSVRQASVTLPWHAKV